MVGQFACLYHLYSYVGWGPALLVGLPMLNRSKGRHQTEWSAAPLARLGVRCSANDPAPQKKKLAVTKTRNRHVQINKQSHAHTYIHKLLTGGMPLEIKTSSKTQIFFLNSCHVTNCLNSLEKELWLGLHNVCLHHFRLKGQTWQ